MRLHVCILCDSRWVPRWAGKEQNAAGGHGSHTPRHSEHVMTKKTPWNSHTQVWLPCPRWRWCLPLPGDAHTYTQDDQYFLLKPHRTPSATTTLTLRWQSTSVHVLVRCKLELPNTSICLFWVHLVLQILFYAIPAFYAVFSLLWCKLGFMYQFKGFKFVLSEGLCKTAGSGLSEWNFIYPQLHSQPIHWNIMYI